MKICTIILLLVTVAESSFLSCSYVLNRLWNTYQCDLSIYDSNGFNNFTEIGGEHSEEYTNFNVTSVVAVHSYGINSRVPRIICEVFPNLDRLYLSKVGLTEIGDADLANCSRITQLELDYNNIMSISTNAFISLRHLDSIYLQYNNLTSLPENVFVSQRNLTFLDVTANPLGDIPFGLLVPLENLKSLFITMTHINEMKSELSVNIHLTHFDLQSNKITALPDSFIGLDQLRYFVLDFNEISEIRSGGFLGLTNLERLEFRSNKLTELQADTFLGLGKLLHLHLAKNPIQLINENAFRGLDSLKYLDLQGCQVRQIRSNYFESLEKLTAIELSYNEIEELPEGVFGALQLGIIYLSSNRLKILRRNSFGSLANLQGIEVDYNEIIAVDKAFVDDAVLLKTFFISENSCASFQIENVGANRTQALTMLEQCFDNYYNIIETTTTASTTAVAVTTIEGTEEIQLPVDQISQNVRKKVDADLFVLICFVLSFSTFNAFLGIYLLIKRQ